MSSRGTFPSTQRSTNARWLDIDRSPSHGWLDPCSGHRIKRAEVLSPCIEDLDFAVQRVPCVEPLAAIAAPTSLTPKRPKIFEIIKDRRSGYRLCHRPAASSRMASK